MFNYWEVVTKASLQNLVQKLVVVDDLVSSATTILNLVGPVLVEIGLRAKKGSGSMLMLYKMKTMHICSRRPLGQYS
jgi:hypothetical protein